MTSLVKDTNPKDAIADKKLPLHLVSGIVKAYQAIAHFLGNVKYGAWNYRAGGARASVYYGAVNRHLDKWWEGEEYDQADGTPHLANALACINILIEAKYGGNLVDDRPPSRDLNPLYKEFEAIMERIRKQYADRNPRHYTIADTPRADQWTPEQIAAFPPSTQPINMIPIADTSPVLADGGKVTLLQTPEMTPDVADRQFQERLRSYHTDDWYTEHGL